MKTEDITTDQCLCRACLATDCEKYLSLFEHYRSFTVYQHINSVAGINIKEGDGLPDKLCTVCLTDLETVLNFKERCERSNNYLLNKSVNKESEDDTEIKEDIKKEDSHNELDYYLVLSEDHLDSNESDPEDKPQVSKKCIIKQEEEEVDVKKREVEIDNKRYDIEGELQCDDCKQYFKSKCKLRVHWKSKHKPKFYYCDLCKKSFKNYLPYKKHVNSKTTCINEKFISIEGVGHSRVFHCKKCGYNTKEMSAMKSHIRVHTKEKRFTCEICSKSYNQKCGLLGHKEASHGLIRKQITCHICGEHVVGRDRVYKHLRKHSSKRFQCDICKKFFKNRDIIIAHFATHGPKNYSCDICGKRYFTNAAVLTHKRCIHFRRLRYSCTLCDFKTNKGITFKKHMINHNRDNISCGKCGRFFDTEIRHKMHMKLHEGQINNKYDCPLCDRIYNNKVSYKSHYKRKHLKERGILETDKIKRKKETKVHNNRSP